MQNKSLFFYQSCSIPSGSFSSDFGKNPLDKSGVRGFVSVVGRVVVVVSGEYNEMTLKVPSQLLENCSLFTVQTT